MIEPITKLEAFKDVVADNRLLETATFDCVQALLQYVRNGRSTASMIVTLDRLRQEFERARP